MWCNYVPCMFLFSTFFYVFYRLLLPSSKRRCAAPEAFPSSMASAINGPMGCLDSFRILLNSWL